MKILLLSHIFYPATDGGSKFVSDLAKILAQTPANLKIITSNCQSTDDFVNPTSPPIASSTSPFDLTRLPVNKTQRLPLKLLSRLSFFSPRLSSLFLLLSKGPFFKLIPLIKTLSSISRFQPELIICGPLPTAIVLYAFIYRFFLRLTSPTPPKLLLCPCLHPTDQSFSLPILKYFLKKADYLYSLTRHEARYYLQNIGLPKSKLIIAKGGIKKCFLASRPTGQPTTPRLLYLGSFSAHKNLETLIDAYTLVKSQIPRLRLTLAGQKTLFYPQIEAKLKQLPPAIRQGIEVITSFPDYRLPRLIDHSSVLIMPSFQESYSLVCLESLARFRPVIVSQIPALIELVGNTKGGLTFNPHHSADLSKKICQLLSQPDFYQRLARQGHQAVKQQYTWDKISNSLCQKLSTS
jgi:glycosyltransferase involved in cell wall biosynthesis